MGSTSFTRRSAYAPSGALNGLDAEVWWAVAPTPLSSETITVNFVTDVDDCAIVAFGVSGADTSAPWDTNSTIPVYVENTSTSSATELSLSTTNPNDLAIVLYANSNGSNPSGVVPSGAITIGEASNSGGTNYAVTYVMGLATDSPLNNETMGWSSNNPGYFLIGDALKGLTSGYNYNLVAWNAVPLPAGSSGNLVYDSDLAQASASVGPTWDLVFVSFSLYPATNLYPSTNLYPGG
jgi:hypothetical protein